MGMALCLSPFAKPYDTCKASSEALVHLRVPLYPGQALQTYPSADEFPSLVTSACLGGYEELPTHLHDTAVAEQSCHGDLIAICLEDLRASVLAARKDVAEE